MTNSSSSSSNTAIQQPDLPTTAAARPNATATETSFQPNNIPSEEDKEQIENIFKHLQNQYENLHDRRAKRLASINFNKRAFEHNNLPKNLNFKLPPYQWPQYYDKKAMKAHHDEETDILFTALMEIAQMRQTVLTNDYNDLSTKILEYTDIDFLTNTVNDEKSFSKLNKTYLAKVGDDFFNYINTYKHPTFVVNESRMPTKDIALDDSSSVDSNTKSSTNQNTFTTSSSSSSSSLVSRVKPNSLKIKSYVHNNDPLFIFSNGKKNICNDDNSNDNTQKNTYKIDNSMSNKVNKLTQIVEMLAEAALKVNTKNLESQIYPVSGTTQNLTLTPIITAPTLTIPGNTSHPAQNNNNEQLTNTNFTPNHIFKRFRSYNNPLHTHINMQNLHNHPYNHQNRYNSNNNNEQQYNFNNDKRFQYSQNNNNNEMHTYQHTQTNNNSRIIPYNGFNSNQNNNRGYYNEHQQQQYNDNNNNNYGYNNGQQQQMPYHGPQQPMQQSIPYNGNQYLPPNPVNNQPNYNTNF